MTISRDLLIRAFLQANGWSAAARAPVAGDASSRRYERLEMTGQKAVLMDAPVLGEGVTCPAGADTAARTALGYTAVARLAGANPHAFICLATELTRRGFSAPRILGADIENGFLLMEDLGVGRVAEDLQKADLQNDSALEVKIYCAAIDTLAAIYRSSFLPDMNVRGAAWHVGDYDALALQAEADLYTDWYAPHFDTKLSADAQTEWQELWAHAFEALGAHASGLALRDFHAENIFYLPRRAGTANIGLIDFQDALFAHPSYDLVSLLEDARRDVDPKLIEPLIKRFCEAAGIKDDDKFRAAYAVQAAQRNAKILGIFVRLNTRDAKPHYLDLIPRVAAHFRHDLSHPALAGLKAWTQKHTPSLWESS